MREMKRKGPSLLNEVLERRMALYALAAGAALAMPGAAQAKVVYTQNNSITQNSVPFYIDLDHDGNSDFSIIGFDLVTATSDSHELAWGVTVNTLQRPHEEFLVSGSAPAALLKGARIGENGMFASGRGTMSYKFYNVYRGNFRYAGQRYLGVRFLIDGQVHYGWIGFRKIEFGFAKFGGWAYETVPNKAIIAGDRGEGGDDAAMEMKAAPGSGSLPVMAERTAMELLAMGHAAIAERQRRMEAIAAS